jgi:serine/threonine-protein kinase RIO1
LTYADLEKLRYGDVFRSRKNRVFRISSEGRTQIAKVYPSSKTDAARKEFEILRKCSDLGILVPKPIELAGNAIVMTFVDGVNASDVVDPLLGEDVPKSSASVNGVAEGLAEWLASFHRAFEFKFCRGDTILRNFLLSDGMTYGIDFEEAHSGDPISDIGELCASILGMRPLFGPMNIKMAASLVGRYWRSAGRNRSSDLPDSVADALEHYSGFREDGPILKARSRKIRAEGLSFLEKPLA